MITTADLAASLLAKLRQLRGPDVAVEQIDPVTCEDGETVMLYCYLAPDGDCEPLSFIPPPCFNPAELETLMLRGGAPVTVH